MKMLLLVPLFLTASCGAGVAADPVRDVKAATRLDQLLAGKAAGATRSCISQRDAREQRVIDDRTILYGARLSAAGGNTVYRSEIRGCPELDDRSTLIRRSTSSSLCSGEIFEVRDSGTGFVYGSCTFGPFTEYRPVRQRL